VTIKHFPLLRMVRFALTVTVFLVISACGGMALPAASEEAPAATTDLAPPSTSTPALSLTQAAVPTSEIPPTQIPVSPAIPETRRLTLEFPPKMKAGVESDIILLMLEVDEFGNITPTAQTGGNVVVGEVVEIPNLYETHTITAEARFDIAGIDVQPSGPIYQPLTRGESVIFYWSVRPLETGTYRGAVWLHLNFVERSSGEESRMALSAQFVEIEAVDFFGFSVDFVRTSGVVGSVLGVIVGFPFFDDAVKYLWNRRKKRKKTIKR
jgi:hypothetical protein